MDGNYAFQVATTKHYKVKKLCYVPNMWEHEPSVITSTNSN